MSSGIFTHIYKTLFRKHILAICLIVILYFSTTAQDKYRPVHWTFNQGLANGTAFCTIKDKNGFLWIGTQQGLSRFDGNIFKNYLADRYDPKAIKGEFIEGLIEDSLHNIWIGTDKGLSRYDILADSLTNYQPLLSKTVSNTIVVPFWATKNEIFCVESDSIITKMNIHTRERKIIVSLQSPDRSPFKIPARNTILDEATHTLWLLINNHEGGLIEISMDGEKQVYHTWQCFKNIPHHSHWSEGMCLDKMRNCIWLNTEDGFLQFTLDDKKFHDVDPLKNSHTRGSSISLDNQSRIWVGTGRANEIMFAYIPEKKQILYPVFGDSLTQHDVNSTNSNIYCDRSGFIWITYWSQGSNSITQLIPFSPTAIRHTVNSNIRSYHFIYSVKEMPDGEVLLPAGNGLYKLNPRTGIFNVIGTKEIKNIRGNPNLSFYGTDAKGQKAWFVIDSSNEPYELDVNTRFCRPLAIIDAAHNKIPHLTFPDGPYFPFQNGILFRAKSGKDQDGLYVIDANQPVIQQIIFFPDEKINKLQLINENHIYVNLDGQFKHLSFFLSNGKWIQKPHPFDNIECDNLLYNEPDQSWWISKGNELVKYDKYFHIIDSFSKREGIPYDGKINSINYDVSGNIWFDTHTLVSKLDIKTRNIFTLNDKDGFENQRYYPGFPIVRVKSGDLYIRGGYEGLDQIKPDQLNTSLPPSLVYLKSVSINQQPLTISGGLNSLENLKLSYTQNMIDIETGIIDYYSKGISRIRYKLEDTRGDWQYGSSNHTIRYEELPSGTHHLLIQASNAVGEFNGPVKRLNIYVSPPYWETWWFRIAAGLLIIGSIFWFIQYRSRQLRGRNLLLEEKVMHRTKELKLSLEELRDTQQQLIQREKMASLGELTAGIAHEIQNPLNFVNNFSEVNVELLNELKEGPFQKLPEIEKKEAGQILEDLTQNLDIINQHGKRADAIVKGMLQHSRVSAGKKEPTDINALTDEFLKLSYHGLRAKENTFNAKINTDLDPQTGLIKIAPQEIGRVLLNLFNNAFYAVTEKKKLLGSSYDPIVWVTSQKNVGFVEIRIKDNGNGIPKKVLEKIFQPFFTTKPTGEGTGLGLSLCYDIITKMHGGEIKAETIEGEYAEFIVRLPI